MKEIVKIDAYVDKDKNTILVPFQKHIIGYYSACEPWKEYSYREWGDIAGYIIELADQICVLGVKEDGKSDVFVNHGVKNFNQFSKKHICLTTCYTPEDDCFETYNYPRLRNGAYGVENGHITEQYSIPYKCGRNAKLIQDNLILAYQDGLNYLKAISSTF